LGRIVRTETNLEGAVAVIGMSGRFPGAANVQEFWRLLSDGVEAISFFTAEQLAAAGVDPREFTQPGYVAARGVLDHADLFDAEFFGVNRREAEVLNPQHRVFLECCWEAFESAGYNPENSPLSIGVFAGASTNDYAERAVSDPALKQSVNSYQNMISNERDFLATRVSYKFNLRGPGINVQSACSTSLVAIHMACQAISTWQCDMALAGGVCIRLPQVSGHLYQEGGINSPDGHCRPFDADARGVVSGNGAGVVLLRRLEDALEAGDPILAVIRGSAVNNDGWAKTGYTAPSIQGQAEVIALAHMVSGVEPETIGYIEAHGTGTQIGDPIEVAALTQAFRASTQAVKYCAIGSVKSNIGHLDAAAGIAGFIKAVLCLRHKKIPPTLHFKRENPHVDFAASPFYVNAVLQEWRSDAPRRAGVSSFGIGGTNAHVILEEAPDRVFVPSRRGSHLLKFSARSEAALRKQMELQRDAIAFSGAAFPLADAAYTLQTGRKPFPYRAAVVCSGVDDAVRQLDKLRAAPASFAAITDGRMPVAFLFSGQGAQKVGMTEQLYRTEPFYREQLDRCAEILKPHLGVDFREVLFPASSEMEGATAKLSRTEFTQPVLFSVEYALARLWMHWGIRPDAMLGHSVGEYTAACLAEVFSLETALEIMAVRGRLMASLPQGSMLLIPASSAEVESWVGQELAVAAKNGPLATIVSGPVEAVERFEREMARKKLQCQRLRTSHAFHSHMMEPVLSPFTAFIARKTLMPPKIPYISNLTGTWIQPSQCTDPGYWAAHLRNSVQFESGLRELLNAAKVFVEVGPGASLTALLRNHPERKPEQVMAPSLGSGARKGEDLPAMLKTAGQLWTAGLALDWPKLHESESRCRVALPTYPFERSRYWIEGGLAKRENHQPPAALGDVRAVEPTVTSGSGSNLKTARVVSPATARTIISSQLKVLSEQLRALQRSRLN
jgi:phthiocerol/phenolphthiocerol synthesis type-I polyketide synthase E